MIQRRCRTPYHKSTQVILTAHFCLSFRFSDGETLKLAASAAAAMEDVRVWIEVWNENAPMPDTLISQSSIHVSDLIKVCCIS